MSGSLQNLRALCQGPSMSGTVRQLSTFVGASGAQWIVRASSGELQDMGAPACLMFGAASMQQHPRLLAPHKGSTRQGEDQAGSMASRRTCKPSAAAKQLAIQHAIRNCLIHIARRNGAVRVSPVQLLHASSRAGVQQGRDTRLWLAV